MRPLLHKMAPFQIHPNNIKNNEMPSFPASHILKQHTHIVCSAIQDSGNQNQIPLHPIHCQMLLTDKIPKIRIQTGLCSRRHSHLRMLLQVGTTVQNILGDPIRCLRIVQRFGDIRQTELCNRFSSPVFSDWIHYIRKQDSKQVCKKANREIFEKKHRPDDRTVLFSNSLPVLSSASRPSGPLHGKRAAHVPHRGR